MWQYWHRMPIMDVDIAVLPVQPLRQWHSAADANPHDGGCHWIACIAVNLRSVNWAGSASRVQTGSAKVLVFDSLNPCTSADEHDVLQGAFSEFFAQAAHDRLGSNLPSARAIAKAIPWEHVRFISIQVPSVLLDDVLNWSRRASLRPAARPSAITLTQ